MTAKSAVDSQPGAWTILSNGLLCNICILCVYIYIYIYISTFILNYHLNI